MSQHQKLICGGLFVIFGATHVGCAGSGLKNIFTRNETDGYHSLDELEAEESGSEVEVEKPSLASRLASWRPFDRVESDTEETFAASEDLASEPDAANTAGSPRFPGLAISKRDSVAPDPFLNAESDHAGRPESPAASSGTLQKTAETGKKRSKTGEEFTAEPDPDAIAQKDTDESIEQLLRQPESKDAVATTASRKPNPARSSSDDENDSLEKRFEQHFLLNSVGTVAKSDTDTATATKMASTKRDLSKIADRQIDQFDYLLAADPAPNVKNSGLQRNSNDTQLSASIPLDSAVEQSDNSLSAFDQFIDHEIGDRAHQATQVAHTTTQTPKTGAARDVNVASAEALFGAAAARQNLRAKQAENLVRSGSDEQSATRSSTGSEWLEDSDGFQWSGSPPEERGSQANNNSPDVSAAFARYVQSNSGSGKQRTHSTAFGAPPVSAGNIEGDDCSVLVSADSRVSKTSTSSAGHQIITADYGTAGQKVAVHSASSRTFFEGDAQFTAAPVAPIPDLESAANVTSQASRPGLVQSFSARNWLLLIGGIIVIALLFAPGRTKPLTMNS